MKMASYRFFLALGGRFDGETAPDAPMPRHGAMGQNQGYARGGLHE
jgi:hypothetical protein